MKFICALLVVSDIKKSREFYEQKLGLKIKIDFGENVTFEGDFAIHSRTHYQGLINGGKIQNGLNNVELYFEYDNIDEIAETLKNTGVEILHEVREQPWKQRVFRIYDPDGYIIEIGESLEHLFFRLSNLGMTDGEISKTTGVPEKIVKSGIEKYKSSL